MDERVSCVHKSSSSYSRTGRTRKGRRMKLRRTVWKPPSVCYF